jgi:hypothetical protein
MHGNTKHVNKEQGKGDDQTMLCNLVSSCKEKREVLFQVRYANALTMPKQPSNPSFNPNEEQAVPHCEVAQSSPWNVVSSRYRATRPSSLHLTPLDVVIDKA